MPEIRRRDTVVIPQAAQPATVGRSGRRSRVRRPWLWLGIGTALGILLFALLGYVLLDARRTLRDGVAHLRDGQAELARPGVHHMGTAEYRRIRSDVDPAVDEFRRAHNRLAPLAPLLHLLSWVPRVGGEVAAAPEIAATADATGQGLHDLLVGVRPVAASLDSGSHVNFAAVLPQIAAQSPIFNAACLSFDQARSERRSISSANLGSAAAQLRTFDRIIAQLRVACRGIVTLPHVMGYPRKRTYLLVYQNTAELRATGGFIGSAGILRFDRGKIGQEFHASDFKDENYTVPSPEPVQYYNAEPYWLFRDSNWSPNYPTSAALERYFLKLDLRTSVDGTINITPEVAQAALAVVGPQYILQYHTLATSANVAQLADFYAHWSTAPAPVVSGNGDTNSGTGRKQFINLVAQRIFSRLEHLPTRAWLSLVQRLGTAVQQKQIQINFVNRDDQRFITMVHADGALARTRADYLYVVDTNLSYNKINPFVHQRVAYSVRVRPDRWLQSTLTLRYENRAPASLIGRGFGPGAGQLGSSVDYADFVRVYVPAGSQLVAQSGWSQPWDPGPAYDKTMLCGYLLVPHNRTATVRLTYVTPPNVFADSSGSRYDLRIQHQAGSHPDGLDVRMYGVGIVTRTWHLQNPLTDATLSAPVRQRPIAPIPLPQQPATTVAPGYWIEPHAYLSAPGKTGR